MIKYLSDVSNLLAMTKSLLQLYTTNCAAVACLVELQLLAGLLGINFGLNAAGTANAACKINSDNGEFTQSVSSTDMYCMKLTCYDKAVMYNDIQCNGNLH